METVDRWLKTKWGRIGVTRFDRKNVKQKRDHVAVAMMIVPSDNRKKPYKVLKYRNAALNWSCDCFDFRYRLRKCKHIVRAVTAYRRYRRDRAK